MKVTTFNEVWPRTPQRDDCVRRLAGPCWRIFLSGLYMTTGRFMPDEAKRKGAYFGFCDAGGQIAPMASATHVGWTVEEER